MLSVNIRVADMALVPGIRASEGLKDVEVSTGQSQSYQESGIWGDPCRTVLRVPVRAGRGGK